jgi:uncharacterized membrane protein YedE/YeeE
MRRRQLISLIAGLIFGVGLILSGMTEPSKVIGFLDLFGDWDPSLAFVMIGAIGVHSLAYHKLIKPRQRPILSEMFHIKSEQKIDAKLLLGAAIFGIGWGLGGYCPGPSIVSIGATSFEAVLFVGGMLGGMLLFKIVTPKKEIPQEKMDVTCG